MREKYHLSSTISNPQRLITNDLYLAAFLMCSGAQLCHLEHNGRRRISFVFSGRDVQQLRAEYESGVVRLNVRSFRDNLIHVRRKMDHEQRSVTHAPSKRKSFSTHKIP